MLDLAHRIRRTVSGRVALTTLILVTAPPPALFAQTGASTISDWLTTSAKSFYKPIALILMLVAIITTIWALISYKKDREFMPAVVAMVAWVMALALYTYGSDIRPENIF